MYTTGSITDVNPGPALHTVMATALTTAGLTLVDTVVITGRTHKIWKSAAASNSLNLDWYLDVNYPTTGITSGLGGFSMQPFEFFDPATDLGYRGCLGQSASSNTTIDATTFSRYGATGSALETNWICGAAQTNYQIALVTAAFTYYISATPERVIVLLSNDPGKIMFSGFYAPDAGYAAKAGAGLYPLVGFRLTAGSDSNSSLGGSASTVTAGLTRFAPVTAFTGGDWRYIASVMQPNTASLPPLAGGDTAAYPFTALPVEIRGASALSPATRFGTVRDVLCIAGGTVARGDTVTISGATWVCTSVGGSQANLFKAV